LKNVQEKYQEQIAVYECISIVHTVIDCLERLQGQSGSSGRGRMYGGVAGMVWIGCVLRVFTTGLPQESRRLRTGRKEKRRN